MLNQIHNPLKLYTKTQCNHLNQQLQQYQNPQNIRQINTKPQANKTPQTE